MAQQRNTFYSNPILICISLTSLVSGLTLPNQVTVKPRHTKFSSSTTEPGSGSLVTPTPALAKDEGLAYYRYINSVSGSTCILLKTDAVIEVTFLLHNLEEKASAFMPEKALVDGDCKNEDYTSLKIFWTGHSLVLSFAKTPGGERWYISDVELTMSPDLPQFRDIPTHGRAIKLYHRGMLIPTPIGKSYSCEEVDIDLTPDESDHPPPGLKGSLLLRKIQLQPFMYKGENFGNSFECKPQKSFRDETAPIAVGSTLAIAVLMTITGYGIFRYFKIKNTQYNTME